MIVGNRCDEGGVIELRVSDIATLMRHASKSASYKPALLKALVRCCQQSAELSITLDSIGREFTKLYWNQTVVYHLRQAASLTKEASAVKLIRKTSEEFKTRDLSALPVHARQALDARMSRLLTVNVLAAFHTSKPSPMPPLYDWKPGWDHIALTPAARYLLRQHAQELELIANFYWAEILGKLQSAGASDRAKGFEGRPPPKRSQVHENPYGRRLGMLFLLRGRFRGRCKTHRGSRDSLELPA